MASLLERLKMSSKDMKEKTISSINSSERGESEFYYPEIDEKKGTAFARIRFLPSADPDANPYVMYFKHFFKGDDGRWIIMNLCPTVNKEECPICEMNRKLWATGIESVQQKVRERSRKKDHVCNILVLDDPEHPEKNGKVFPFRFGTAIFNKISDALKPQFEGDETFNPFDIWEGADFELRIIRDKSKGGQISYDNCRFSSPKPLYDGDEARLEEVVSQLIDLKKYIDPENSKVNDAFLLRLKKAYEKLSKNLDEEDQIIVSTEQKNFRDTEENDTVPFDESAKAWAKKEKAEKDDEDLEAFFDGLK